jgi:anti-anti-sigma factor
MDDNNAVNILQVESDETGHGARLTGSGEIDAYSVTVLRDAIESALRGTAERIELDLSRVTFIDSSALRALAEARVRADQIGRSLWISELSAPVRRILEISGMLDELTRAPSQ